MSVLRTWRMVLVTFKFQFCGSLGLKGRKWVSETEKEGEACELWDSEEVCMKGIHRNVCIQGATQNANYFRSGEAVICVICEAESDTAISRVEQRTVVVWARSGPSSFWARSRYGDLLCQGQDLQMQMDAASVTPALTLWQLSGMQSGNTIWDIAFPT